LVTKFVLLSTQRSGSSWAIDTLDSHPRVRVSGELFLGAVRKDARTGEDWLGSREFWFWNGYWARVRSRLKVLARPYYCFRYLNDVYHPGQKSPGAIGFKLMYNHVYRHPELVAYMMLHRVRVVHLVRENMLDTIVSAEAASVRGAPHSRAPVENVRIRLDTSALLRKLGRLERHIRWARRIFSHLGLPYLELTYEHLLSGRAAFGVALRFLGICPSGWEPGSVFKKLMCGSHRDTIENYECVRAALRGTKYGSLLG
jgi:LPS sulfotransferase NodH